MDSLSISFSLCDRPLQYSRTAEKTDHGKGKTTSVVLEPSLTTFANPSLYLNHFWVVVLCFLSRIEPLLLSSPGWS
jgi:hypothetical protein